MSESDGDSDRWPNVHPRQRESVDWSIRAFLKLGFGLAGLGIFVALAGVAIVNIYNPWVSIPVGVLEVIIIQCISPIIKHLFPTDGEVYREREV